MLVTKYFFVDFRSVDAGLNITNSGLLNMFEDIACLHAQRLGEDISSSDLRWLLSRYRVAISRRPKYGEELQVTTWSKDYKNVTATREFEVRDASGALIVTCWSQWARVNITTREPVRLTDEYMAPYRSEPERTNFGKPARVSEPADMEPIADMIIDWRWMDHNCHMHNSWYTDVVEHFLPEELRSRAVSCDFDISYKQEILQDTTVRFLLSVNENGWTVALKNEDMSVLHAIITYSAAE